jgi:hypothetical protein
MIFNGYKGKMVRKAITQAIEKNRKGKESLPEGTEQ